MTALLCFICASFGVITGFALCAFLTVGKNSDDE